MSKTWKSYIATQLQLVLQCVIHSDDLVALHKCMCLLAHQTSVTVFIYVSSASVFYFLVFLLISSTRLNHFIRNDYAGAKVSMLVQCGLLKCSIWTTFEWFEQKNFLFLSSAHLLHNAIDKSSMCRWISCFWSYAHIHPLIITRQSISLYLYLQCLSVCLWERFFFCILYSVFLYQLQK